jgi:hypothetical protein
MTNGSAWGHSYISEALLEIGEHQERKVLLLFSFVLQGVKSVHFWNRILNLSIHVAVQCGAQYDIFKLKKKI